MTLSSSHCTVATEHGLEFNASARNEYGTGYDIEVSNPVDGYVDILIWQVVAFEVPEEPSITLSLPLADAWILLKALEAGVQVALNTARLRQYN